jgi:hypothetical protein
VYSVTRYISEHYIAIYDDLLRKRLLYSKKDGGKGDKSGERKRQHLLINSPSLEVRSLTKRKRLIIIKTLDSFNIHYKDDVYKILEILTSILKDYNWK